MVKRETPVNELLVNGRLKYKAIGPESPYSQKQHKAHMLDSQASECLVIYCVPYST